MLTHRSELTELLQSRTRRSPDDDMRPIGVVMIVYVKRTSHYCHYVLAFFVSEDVETDQFWLKDGISN